MKKLIAHVSGTAIEASLVALLVVGLMAGTAFAAKGGGGGKPVGGSSAGTLALVLVADQDGSGTPNWSDTVTFNASTSATTEPHVRLQCVQGGSLVYTGDAGMYASYPWPWEQNMTLSSSLWTAGAADCTAQIYYFSRSKTVWGSSLTFQVAA
jgi:hypothetical protein